MRIIRLEIEDFMRVKTFAHDVTSDVVELSGDNGAGKTSSMQAIAAVLYGASQIPDEPVRRGADEARIKAWLGDKEVELIVTRTIKPDRKTYLSLKAADGTAIPGGAQAELNAMIDSQSIDPLAFLRASAKEQRVMLGAVLGIDAILNEIAHNYDTTFATRTEVNRTVRELQARIDAIEVSDETKVTPVDVASLLDELKRKDEANRTVTATLTRIAELRAEAERIAENITQGEQRLAQMRETLALKRDAIAAMESQQTAEDNTESLRERIRHATAINAEYARRVERTALLGERDAARNKAEALTNTLVDIEAEKTAVIAATPMPVPGLGIEPDRVTLNGLPLSQSSGAEGLRLALKIAMAAKPALRVIRIAYANLMSGRTQEILREEIASQPDAERWQVWAEYVDETRTRGIVMEDGEIAVNNYVPAVPTIGDVLHADSLPIWEGPHPDDATDMPDDDDDTLPWER